MPIISFIATSSFYRSSIQACVKELGSPIQDCVKKCRSFDSSLILNRSTQAGVQKTTKARKVPFAAPATSIDSTARRIRSTVQSVLHSNLRRIQRPLVELIVMDKFHWN